MNSDLTIVMYHYVREINKSRYPNIKGLEANLFKDQISCLENNYTFIRIEDVIECIYHKKSLPEKSILLTFDDAYIEHFNIVFPLLKKKNIQGSFYPAAKTILEHKVLIENKIHFILSINVNIKNLVSKIKLLLEFYKNDFQLNNFDYYYLKLAKPTNCDDADTIFVKRLLQYELNIELRIKIVNILFDEFIGISEEVFSRELYMNIDHIKFMLDCGMHFGSHGYEHYWLNTLSKSEQEEEIKKSLLFLKEIGADLSNWTMCYPHGGYNKDTIDLLEKNSCKLAFTIQSGVANLRSNNKYELPRIDTNELSIF
jgi:peptidoglycan/xylan/chitin deacetylase (PgdA/CDA1 family)